jgi:hypothetical protein
MRVLAYRIQAAAFGDLDRTILRRLRDDALESGDAHPFAPRGPTRREGVGLRADGRRPGGDLLDLSAKQGETSRPLMPGIPAGPVRPEAARLAGDGGKAAPRTPIARSNASGGAPPRTSRRHNPAGVAEHATRQAESEQTAAYRGALRNSRPANAALSTPSGF